MMSAAVTFGLRCGFSVSRLYAAECGSAATHTLPELIHANSSGEPSSAFATDPPWHPVARHPDIPTAAPLKSPVGEAAVGW